MRRDDCLVFRMNGSESAANAVRLCETLVAAGHRPAIVPFWAEFIDYPGKGDWFELPLLATGLFERVDNALKLIGDQYLSRIFELASNRFHLRGWQQSIRRKLETVGDVYDLLIQQAAGHRMEALEITVVLLITIEILLALWRH